MTDFIWRCSNEMYNLNIPSTLKKIKILLNYIILIAFVVSYGQQSYYNDVNIDLTGISLKNALTTKITATHTVNLSYDQAREALKIVDLVPGQGDFVYLLYGYSNNTCPTNTGNDHRTRNKASFGGGASCEWNREHTYAQSLGTPELGQSGPGADAHHLRASDVQRNSLRGNLKFIDGSGTSKATGGGWYPGDEWKGDVARMMMYMYVRYGNQCLPKNITIGTTNTIDSDMIDILLQWNAEDPVSEYEDYRNNYLGNSSNTYGQGNRNPFIDNPYLATRIWGGQPAVDRWNYYSTDTEVPTTPTNLTVSNITLNSLTLSWNASTDNIAVTGYEIYKNDVFLTTTTNLTYEVTGLSMNTGYTFKVRAKDAANNFSGYSNNVNPTTLADTDAPSIPSSLAFSNLTATSVNLSWNPSTDNVGVFAYDVYKDDVFLTTTSNTSFMVTGLTPSTSYTFKVRAKDASNNSSDFSNVLNITTSSSTGGGTVTELFISEYVEGTSNNKAIEIANFTGSSISLSNYSLKKQVNGAGSWGNELLLTGTLNDQNVYLIANSASVSSIVNIANKTSGAPMDFNGNDPIGLFKNGVLIDIVGVLNITTDFAANTTLRRKSNVTSPNTTYTLSEWESFPVDTFSGLGSHTVTLSVNEYLNSLFKIYPNPTSNNQVFIKIDSSIVINHIEVFNLTGKVIKSIKNPEVNSHTMIINDLPIGFYIVKLNTEQGQAYKKIIVN